MSRSLLVEPDYVFGQRMLTLRTSLGLTQEGLAAALGITRKTIGRWEAGERYPKAAYLQALLALALQHRVFSVGQEEEEIRAFWYAAHQKVLLDETWLHELLSPPAPPWQQAPGELNRAAKQFSALPSGSEPRVDWGEALDVPSFYGREEELALLSRWIAEERCRVVSVLGMGGIGKSALAITAMHQVARQFEVVIWRSLRDAPTCATLVESCFQALDPQAQSAVPDALEERLHLLMEQLRTRRVLLVLDNLETLLEEGTGTGRLHAGAQGYAQLLRQMGETRHQSCLLLTSREKPADLVPLEGKRSPVRALRLAGLDELAGVQVLREKEVMGSPQDLMRLVEVYQGNPLALKIVAQTIVELYGGEILPFLRQGDGKVRWWEVQSGACVQVHEGHQGAVHALKVSPDSVKLASCGDDGTIVLWDLARGKPLHTLRRDRPYERLNITGIRGLSAAQKTSLHALGALEETSSLVECNN